MVFLRVPSLVHCYSAYKPWLYYLPSWTQLPLLCWWPSNLLICFHCSAFFYTTINVCITDIKIWLHNNFLKCNTDKTKIIVFGPPSLLNKSDLSFVIVRTCFISSQKNLDLGVTLDCGLTFQWHRNPLVILHFPPAQYCSSVACS